MRLPPLNIKDNTGHNRLFLLSRLDRYDLATNFIPIGIQQPAQSQLMSTAGFVMAQPAAAAAPAMVPVTMLTQQTCMPIFTATR